MPGWVTELRSLVLLTLLFSMPSSADEEEISFDIPSQRADYGLTAFADQAGLTLFFPFDAVKTKTTNAVRGKYSIEEGLALLLEDTGLTGALALPYHDQHRS